MIGRKLRVRRILFVVSIVLLSYFYYTFSFQHKIESTHIEVKARPGIQVEVSPSTHVKDSPTETQTLPEKEEPHEEHKHEDSQNNEKPHETEHHEHIPLVLLTTAATGDMQILRELVGSLHKLRKNNLDVHTILVYGFGMQRKERNELQLWRNVEYIDGYAALFLGQRTMPLDIDDPVLPEPAVAKKSISVILNAIDMNLRKYGNVLYVKDNLRFNRDSIHEIADIIYNGGGLIAASEEERGKLSGHAHLNEPFPFGELSLLGFKFGSDLAHLFITFQLQCLRGYHCEDHFYQELLLKQNTHLKQAATDIQSLGLELFDNKPDRYCNLLLRDDILYSFEYGSSTHDGHVRSLDGDHEHSHYSEKTVIAIGMPTLSVNDLENFNEVAPVRLFFPAFLHTVSDDEWKRFKYMILIGYDEGDKYFGNKDDRSSINKELMALFDAHKKQVATRLKLKKEEIESYFSLEVEYIEFPFSKGWVTYIWNGLFVHAVKDGADYFYQVNDDLRLESSGWSTIFVDEFKKMNDIGVVGPTDPRHGGALLTQAFVSKKHHQIFGKLYPLDIKDWYSDNWITDVYGDNRKTINGINVYNVNDKGTRYTICMQPRYQEILDRGKRVLQDWLDDANDKSESKTDESRIARELAQGPILQ